MTLRVWQEPEQYSGIIIGIVTGGFDPIHSGHIDYFVEASKNVINLLSGQTAITG